MVIQIRNNNIRKKYKDIGLFKILKMYKVN